MLSLKNYPYKTWSEKYKIKTKTKNENGYIVDIQSLEINESWKSFFDSVKDKPYYKKIEEFLTMCLNKTEGKIKIYPYPDLVFNVFNSVPLDNIKVVILGQDPYHQSVEKDDKIIPQAMGLSFSVPVGVKTPSSLVNIYKNALKFNIIKKIPSHGNLTSWVNQGVFLLNTSLTVQHGYPNSHAKKWTPFTDDLIKYISDNTEKLVFVLWGKPALQKLNLIDDKKHKILISSHPSGLSCHKGLGDYDAFMDKNHFGEINEYLKENNKEEIKWDF